jgi:glycosyltransferase A (GT-A) superfamily protein (DUF2064 family)
MNGSRNALVLFTKAPTPGVTKTRLTTARGGILTPEEAAALYQATLLDVADTAHAALENCRRDATPADGQPTTAFDFVISAANGSDRDRLQALFSGRETQVRPDRYIVDRGSTFDEHFNDAFQQLLADGYHAVVAIGGDLPALRPYHIRSAYEWLDYLERGGRGALVLAPCQDCGVSIVGVTAGTPIDFSGVFYNFAGVSALDQITMLCAQANIPLAMLDQISDVDTVGDLAHTVTLLRCLAYAVGSQPDVVLPARTLAWVQQTGIVVSTPPNVNHDPREAVDVVH